MEILHYFYKGLEHSLTILVSIRSPGDALQILRDKCTCFDRSVYRIL
jgi:hypothetical protein